ncbi:hypothetical protein DOTSEDRAFT_67570 [Dothistroma septosporum NZE10]|uniref:Uncharacterized protein n=1 Tax=Dothistroma septosporum (strain NZE10 / CBS 128990) TaxID=675120 RepID=N1PZY8_DOTSN|nr:hypothetical protein DOTSEDRAFT_67570 [Dothistroma septosporum NZE10]
MAPWVHNEHSNVALSNMISKLPDAAFSCWSGVSKVFSQNIMPVSGWSGGIISSVSGIFSGQTETTNDSKGASHEKYGTSEAVENQIDNLQAKYVFAEGMTGANDEALLCAKKGPNWGVCEDYMECVKQVASRERERHSGARLRVRLHFAASDVLIGEGGKEYFRRCWAQGDVADVVDVQHLVWPETNHDSVSLDFQKGAIRSIFEQIKDLHDEAVARES